MWLQAKTPIKLSADNVAAEGDVFEADDSLAAELLQLGAAEETTAPSKAKK